jgi:hypothetical protein
MAAIGAEWGVDNLWITTFHIMGNALGTSIGAGCRAWIGGIPDALYGPARGLPAMCITCAYVDKSVDNPVDSFHRSDYLNGYVSCFGMVLVIARYARLDDKGQGTKGLPYKDPVDSMGISMLGWRLVRGC